MKMPDIREMLLPASLRSRCLLQLRLRVLRRLSRLSRRSLRRPYSSRKQLRLKLVELEAHLDAIEAEGLVLMER